MSRIISLGTWALVCCSSHLPPVLIYINTRFPGWFDSTRLLIACDPARSPDIFAAVARRVRGADRTRTRPEVNVKKKKKHRFLKTLLLLAAAGGAVAYWNGLDESRKRFLIHLAKQAPYTPFRYFA